MRQALQGFAYQAEDGQTVTVAGGQVVNDDDPVLDGHGDKFGPYTVPYVEAKKPKRAASKKG